MYEELYFVNGRCIKNRVPRYYRKNINTVTIYLKSTNLGKRFELNRPERVHNTFRT